MNKIAIIVAHSDDEVLSAGGLIWKAKDKEPLVIYTSTSDYMDYDLNIHRTEDEARIETEASLEALGVPMERALCLHYKTKYVPYNSEIIEKLDRIFKQYNIDTVVTHNVDDDHHDHANTARAVMSAARRLPNILTFEPVFPANSRHFFHPNWYLDISGEAYTRKLMALAKHTSQVKKYGVKWFDSADALSRLRGIEIGTERAECFCLLKRQFEL